jgi:uncharacterized repeat protein (TIGR03806 family)
VKRVALLLLAAACGGSHVTPPGGDGSYLRDPYASLAQYGVVDLKAGDISPREGVIAYDLNTPLWSDGALKRRAVFLPAGAAQYDESAAFTFPAGTLLIKSFGFPDDLRKPAPKITWIETRILMLTSTGWRGMAYVWDAAQQGAALHLGSEVRDLSWIDAQGATHAAHYLIPSAAQCQDCHSNNGAVTPIGLKARNLNRDFAYPGAAAENQLAHWTRIGALSGAPDPAQAPRLAVWNDPATGSAGERARAYLEGNCAHCHSAGGSARTSGLFLGVDVTTPAQYGVCKAPIAAGQATGGFSYDVVPGDPDHSVMAYRLASTQPGIAMPLIGRSVVDDGGLALVRQWISELAGHCN